MCAVAVSLVIVLVALELGRRVNRRAIRLEITCPSSHFGHGICNRALSHILL
jgi:hypothetical protein